MLARLLRWWRSRSRTRFLFPAQGLEDWRSLLLHYHNEARVSQKLRALRPSLSLDRCAQAHATWMAQSKQVRHEGPRPQEGGPHPDLEARLRALGYSFVRAGENLAPPSYQVPLSVWQGWWQSPAHRQNILGPYQEIGLGWYEDYWCVVLATPVNPSLRRLLGRALQEELHPALQLPESLAPSPRPHTFPLYPPLPASPEDPHAAAS